MAHACIAWAPAFDGGHAPDEPVWRSIRTQPAQSAFSATSYFAVVFAATSSAVTPGASSISLNGLAWSSRLNTARSVTIMSTTFLPVSGSVQAGKNKPEERRGGKGWGRQG